MSQSPPLEPLETLLDLASGPDVPLPAELQRLYGPLRLRQPADRPLIITNFVSTLDGVISLSLPGKAGGEPISGGSRQDVMVMGLLRAVADAIIVGAGSLRAGPNSRLTAEYVFPPLADAYRALRRSRGRPPAPLSVVVTARGSVDAAHPIFSSGDVPALVLTTDAGRARLAAGRFPRWVAVESLGPGPELSPAEILGAVRRHQQPCEIILSEGGPGLHGDFLAARLIDELFLTLAPQIAGRAATDRPGLAAGHEFAPDDSRWGELVGVKRGGGHLFLRYSLQGPPRRP